MGAIAELVGVTQALADPVRLLVLQRLMAGPAMVSELMAATGASQPNVSNHLALLRERRLVRVDKQGRQAVYELRDATVGELIESLGRVTGARLAPAGGRPTPRIASARTCYDHLAGKLGVALFDALAERGAVVTREGAATGGRAGTTAAVELGAGAAEAFGRLGVDVTAVPRGRRKLATACLDWTERRQHLGGALGAAVWAAAMERGWVVREPGTRALIVTDAGRSGWHEALGVRLAEVSA